MTTRRSQRAFPEWPLLLLALAIVGAVCIPLWQWTAPARDGGVVLTGERIARMLLGPEQIVSYACFMWACFILVLRYAEVRRQQRAFNLNLLPTDEGVRILPEDARTMQRRVEQLSERGGPSVLSRMIRLALSKFAVSRSPQDASETVRTQAEVELGHLASSMATVHYLAWAIPAIGFVGTVRGIGLALTVVNDIETNFKGFMDDATRSLALAFDTTLVALLLSLVLMFLMHSVQRAEEELVLDSQEYCLEHLINRLYDLEPSRPESAEMPAPDFGTEKVWPL